MAANQLDYSKALRLGEKAFKTAQAKGDYPYLPALDSFLRSSDIRAQTELGLVEIPLDQIAGTKTAGRQNSFACNFMPLLKENTEFALKWMNVFKYQMEEGINDPIVAYEFMNKYYVLEGNKRVSVLKYLGAFSIEGTVTRIVPRYRDDPQVRIFYEYMEFYAKTAINYIWFSKEGSFAALVKACGMGAEEIWDDDQRKTFSSCYKRFQKIYTETGADSNSLTDGDAFLFYLSLYPYREMEEKTDSMIRSEIIKMRGEFEVIAAAPDTSLVLDPTEGREAGIFTRFFTSLGSKQLKIAFVHDKPARSSGWVYAHELGRMHLEQTFGSLVKTTVYDMSNPTGNAQAVIEAAIEDGNHIIFTTSERLLSASLKAALEHPQVKILNCSVNRPYRSLRTYYGRMYEAKYLEGMIAGAMCEDDRIAYCADYPIYGTVASINAFALGAAATNPRVKIYLHWNCEKDSSLSDLIEKHQIRMVSDVDMIRPEAEGRQYGLYRIRGGKCESLAAPIWNWGKFYEKIVRDIVSGFWNEEKRAGKVLNYWWGISGDIIDLIIAKRVPAGIRSLTLLVRSSIYRDLFHPFEGPILRQDNSIAGQEGEVLDPESIITMDWLCANVIGSFPEKDRLSAEALDLVRIQGVMSRENGIS